MSSRPEKFPRWASGDTYGSGPKASEDTKVEPTDGEKTRGWYPDKKPPARKANWLFNIVSRWINYIGDVPVLNWHSSIIKDIANATIDTTSQRFSSGLHGIFFDPVRGYWWATGSNTSKQVYFGDFDYMTALNTAVVVTAASFKIHAGVALASGHVLLMTNELFGAADNVESIARSDDAPIAGSMAWTSRTIGGPCSSGARCGDIIVTDSDRVIVVGYQDGDQIAWVSDDDGVTWTPKTVGTMASSIDGLAKIIKGKDGLLVAFVSAPAGDGGDSLWISDDDGETWSERTTIGFDDIKDAAYSESRDRYYFAHDTSVSVVQDVENGVFTEYDVETEDISAGDVTALGCFGSALIAATNLDAGVSFLLMSWNDGETWQLVHRTRTDIFGIGVSPQGQFAGVGFFSGAGMVQVSMKAAEQSR